MNSLSVVTPHHLPLTRSLPLVGRILDPTCSKVKKIAIALFAILTILPLAVAVITLVLDGFYYAVRLFCPNLRTQEVPDIARQSSAVPAPAKIQSLAPTPVIARFDKPTLPAPTAKQTSVSAPAPLTAPTPILSRAPNSQVTQAFINAPISIATQAAVSIQISSEALDTALASQPIDLSAQALVDTTVPAAKQVSVSTPASFEALAPL